MTARRLLSAAASSIIVACALGGAACGGSAPPPSEGTATAAGGTFTRDDREIGVHAGERFVLELSSNPSVGDDWRVVGGPRAGLLELVSESYESESAEPMPGSGGAEQFLFEAVGPGTTTVTVFNCFRCGADEAPLPENEPYAETLTFSVRIS